MAQDAPQIDRIEQLVRSADFAAAETQAQAALASGKLKRRDVARTYLQLGIVATAKRADDPAQAAFRRALALEPSLTLPDSAGPHIGEAFDQAKAVMARSPRLAVSAHLTEVPNRPEIWVDAQISGDSEGLVRRLRVDADGVPHLRDLHEASLRFLESLPKTLSRCTAISVDALDEHGNELYPGVARTEVCPASPVQGEIVTAPPEAAPSNAPTKNARPVPAHVWTLAAVTGAAAVATGVLGTVALGKAHAYNDNANKGQAERDTALGAEHRATAAAILTGVAGAATLLFYVTRPEQPVRAGAWVSPGTAMLFVSAGL